MGIKTTCLDVLLHVRLVDPLNQQRTLIMGLLTLLVHNDAIKTDPKEIYGWRVYAVACAVSLFPRHEAHTPANEI